METYGVRDHARQHKPDQKRCEDWLTERGYDLNNVKQIDYDPDTRKLLIETIDRDRHGRPQLINVNGERIAKTSLAVLGDQDRPDWWPTGGRL